jgi:hypothetical protein
MLEGIPSAAKLTSLPIASPLIKTIFTIVAVSQYRTLKVHATQIITIPRYKHITALKILWRSVVSTLKSNNTGKIVPGAIP